MENAVQIEKLMCFGLTRQEAVIYLTLHMHGELSGYEVSKLTGISRSNAYNSLAALVEKGAAYLVEGNVSKYVCVDAEELCDNKIRLLQENKTFLLRNMPDKKEEAVGYVTIEGNQHILDKLRTMLRQTKFRVYLSMDAKLLSLVVSELEELLEQKKKVVLITDQESDLPGALQHFHESQGNQIQVITDSAYVLTGEFDKSALYSGQEHFVNVCKNSMRNEIKLILLTKGETAK